MDDIHIFFPDALRLNCGKANTYNVEKSEKMRDGEMTSSQESNTPPAPEEETEVQGTAFILAEK